MESVMAEVVRKARDEFDSHVTKRWPDVPVGSFLCVHETVKDHPSGDNFKLIFEVSTHILKKAEACDVGGRRTQFGPKGE